MRSCETVEVGNVSLEVHVCACRLAKVVLSTWGLDKVQGACTYESNVPLFGVLYRQLMCAIGALALFQW